MPLLWPLLVQARQQAIAVVIARPILVKTNVQPSRLPVRESITDIPAARGQVIITTIINVNTNIMIIISSRRTGMLDIHMSAIMAVRSVAIMHKNTSTTAIAAASGGRTSWTNPRGLLMNQCRRIQDPDRTQLWTEAV
jgi:hypothetical protein